MSDSGEKQETASVNPDTSSQVETKVGLKFNTNVKEKKEKNRSLLTQSSKKDAPSSSDVKQEQEKTEEKKLKKEKKPKKSKRESEKTESNAQEKSPSDKQETSTIQSNQEKQDENSNVNSLLSSAPVLKESDKKLKKEKKSKKEKKTKATSTSNSSTPSTSSSNLNNNTNATNNNTNTNTTTNGNTSSNPQESFLHSNRALSASDSKLPIIIEPENRKEGLIEKGLKKGLLTNSDKSISSMGSENSSDRPRSSSGASDGPISTIYRSSLVVPQSAVVKVGEKLELDPEMLVGLQPLLVFVNKKSGGQQGTKLLDGFKKLLNPIQVFDLGEGGPQPGLELFTKVPNARILVCGGDGTAGWVFVTIDKMKLNHVPPVAILPLGTGNDLARVSNWGGGYEGEKLTSILKEVDRAIEISFDRWSLNIGPKKENDTYETPTLHSIVNNYFSIGVDAAVALDFHHKREAHPEKFKSRFGNKVSYTVIGSRKLFYDSELNKNVELTVDGKIIPIPIHSEGLIVLNLNSYMGGTDLWGEKLDDRFKRQEIDDGEVEVLTVNGSFHLGIIKAKLSHGTRLAQGKDVKIKLHSTIAAQIDGEPWLQDPAIIEIKHHSKSKLLKKVRLPKESPEVMEYIRKNLLIPESAFIRSENKIQLNRDIMDTLIPLLVFVNRKSGGQQGGKLIEDLKGLLHPNQIFDLSEGGPQPGLELFGKIPNTRILVCGGDGTVGWVFMTLDKARLDFKPMVAVLPLGTGNDFARSFGWGGAYNGEKMGPILRQIGKAEEIMVDRWNVNIAQRNEDGAFGEFVHYTVFNNYLGVGVDASISLEFHHEREANPEKFKSRLGNKLKYGTIGANKLFHSNRLLYKEVKLEVDGVNVDIPHDAQGIILLNIDSFAGGSNPWGTSHDPKWKPQKPNDQLLEVVAVNGAFHLGAIQTHLTAGIRLAQGKSVKFALSQEIPVEVDGEPWSQDPCVIEVTHLNQARTLRKVSKNKPSNKLTVNSNSSPRVKKADGKKEI